MGYGNGVNKKCKTNAAILNNIVNLLYILLYYFESTIPFA